MEALRIARNTPHVRAIPRAEAAMQLAAFEMFEARHTLMQVMRALDLTVQKVQSLHRAWSTPLGATRTVPTFLELSETNAKEVQGFASDFEREQRERKTKLARDHEERMREMDDLLTTRASARKKRP